MVAPRHVNNDIGIEREDNFASIVLRVVDGNPGGCGWKKPRKENEKTFTHWAEVPLVVATGKFSSICYFNSCMFVSCLYCRSDIH